MKLEPRAHLAQVRPCPHGSLSTREMGGFEGQMLDFSVNANPLGVSPLVQRAVLSVRLDRYPDDGSPQLVEALAAAQQLPAEQVIVGNGSSELIGLLTQAYLQVGDNVVVAGPTYGEYRRAASIAGAVVHEYRALAEQHFRPDLAELAAMVRNLRPRLVFVCNPNNPTGVYLPATEIAAVLRACEHGLLVVDEAYLNFVSQTQSLLPLLPEGVVLLRSLTKDEALAGLRLGYALAQSEVIRALRTVQLPWSVNAAAQAAGLAALQDEKHLRQGRRAAQQSLLYLQRELRRLGLEPLPSEANFLLVRVGEAAALRARLLRLGIAVRDCSSFGLPEYIRLGSRPLAECRALVAALREVLGAG